MKCGRPERRTGTPPAFIVDNTAIMHLLARESGDHRPRPRLPELKCNGIGAEAVGRVSHGREPGNHNLSRVIPGLVLEGDPLVHLMDNFAKSEMVDAVDPMEKVIPLFSKEAPQRAAVAEMPILCR